MFCVHLHYVLSTVMDLLVYLNSVHNDIFVSGTTRHHRLHFPCGYILSFPAEGVTSAVLEVQVALVIHHQYITWEINIEIHNMIKEKANKEKKMY